MSGDDATAARIAELEARIEELEGEKRQLRASAEDVAAANVNAALQMLAMSDANMRELQEKNEQVERALSIALEASEQRAQFLANMSHELRTPISGILGLVDLLLASDLNQAQRDHVDAIATTADSFLMLVNQVLDFAKVQSDGLEIEHVEFDLWDALENVALLLQAHADQKKIEFLFDLDPKLPRRVLGDPLRLRQILLNLGSNAIKFTDRGVVSFSAEVDASSDAPGALRIHIEDTGCGIDEAQSSVIFEAFRQADASTTRRYGGTGLGLAICRELLEAMGGEICFSSVPEVGTSFVVALRFEPAPSAALESASGESARGSALVLARRPCTVSALGKHLPKHGFDVLQDEGEAEDASVDLVLLELPWNAREELPRLRARYANAAFVLVDDAALSADEELLREHGIVDVLLRPLRPSRLAATLTGLREIRSAGREEGAADAPFAGARVLVVEDTKINQSVLSHQLERLGCVVTLADDGVEGVDTWLDSGPFDIVFMDGHMPRMNGFDATFRIRELEKARLLARTPIVCLTADARDAVAADCARVGMDAFCSKPLRQAELVRLLQRWVRASTAS